MYEFQGCSLKQRIIRWRAKQLYGQLGAPFNRYQFKIQPYQNFTRHYLFRFFILSTKIETFFVDKKDRLIMVWFWIRSSWTENVHFFLHLDMSRIILTKTEIILLIRYIALDRIKNLIFVMLTGLNRFKLVLFNGYVMRSFKLTLYQIPIFPDARRITFLVFFIINWMIRIFRSTKNVKQIFIVPCIIDDWSQMISLWSRSLVMIGSLSLRIIYELNNRRNIKFIFFENNHEKTFQFFCRNFNFFSKLNQIFISAREI